MQLLSALYELYVASTTHGIQRYVPAVGWKLAIPQLKQNSKYIAVNAAQPFTDSFAYSE